MEEKYWYAGERITDSTPRQRVSTQFPNSEAIVNVQVHSFGQVPSELTRSSSTGFLSLPKSEMGIEVNIFSICRGGESKNGRIFGKGEKWWPRLFWTVKGVF